MNKRQVEQSFRENILPHLPANDRPGLREAWNNYVDALQRDGQITERQASTWDQPAFVREKGRT